MKQSVRRTHFWFYLLLLAFPGSVIAQIQPLVPKAVTRAVVVGISNYSNISKLRFAHRDAESFASFLRSPAGGGLTENEIRLLTEEKATYAQIVNALYWLIGESQPNDKAIIYFSGHGDVENNIPNMGFLLTYDTPKTNYMLGGISIMNLQTIITTLAVSKQVQVLMIADACRSGNLASSGAAGSQTTALLLAKQFANEVKIMSCGPDELSLENEIWGGGHSVFSFYLINGLKGLADYNEDREITLKEIERFLQDSVEMATRSIRSQTPQAEGDARFVVAKVDPATAAALKQKNQPPPVEAPVMAKTPALSPQTSDSLVLKLYRDFEKALAKGHLLQPEEGSAYTIYMQIKDHPSIRSFKNLMRNDLAISLQDDAQKAINDYLSADPREMRKRWALDDSRYQTYPLYLEKAAELLGETHLSYAQVKAKEYYFSGLVMRLKGERSKNQLEKDSLYRVSRSFQDKVLKLDTTAAYAYNELGLLARRASDNLSSIKYFNQAISFSPNWALPWANLGGSLEELNRREEAEQCGIKAISIDSTFALAHYNLGNLYLGNKNLDKAASHFEKTITYSPDYYNAYFNLGLYYYQKENYVQSESLFFEYNRKVPNDPDGYQNLGETSIKLGKLTESESFFLKALDMDPNYANAYLGMGGLFIEKNERSKAISWINQFIGLKPNDPEGYLKLAMAYSDQPEKALSHLESALKLGLKNTERIPRIPQLKAISTTKEFKNLMEKYNPGRP
ncbi:MAG: tetratricopeptide repeat protein [Saprospiraceae bacterium]|nr:tetratricopeptide repeat protein [Saprospiraceae bacterium]